MAFELIEIEALGPVVRLWLSRPAQRNAQSEQMLTELDAAFRAAFRAASSLMGLRKAKEMLFTDERIGATEAHAIGMVNRVVVREQLDGAALALAERIAQAPPFGVQLLKRSLNRSLDAQGLRTALSAHFDTHQLSHMTAEFGASRAAGMAAGIQRGRDAARNK